MELRTVVDGYTFFEGPRWHDGRLYVSDFYSHQEISADADVRVEARLATEVEVPRAGLP